MSRRKPWERSIIDIHTHIYPPSYLDYLKQRHEVPYLRKFPNGDRLVILPSDDDGQKPLEQRGRPITSDFWDIQRKLDFMNKHQIDISVLSLANPWLDWVPSENAHNIAAWINDEFNSICEQRLDRFYAFGTLPLSADVPAIINEIRRLKGKERFRGVIMGTTGLGWGMDDTRLDEVYRALEETDTLVFLHPHYGLPDTVYGPRNSEYGHVLPLALGFPMETTIAVTRMYVSGVFDRFKKLKVLLAHSGGTLPFLAGRIESCIQHDAHLASQHGSTRVLERSIWEVLKTNIYLDAVVYSEVGLRAAKEATDVDKIMFGTDHPFFPPPDRTVQDASVWKSMTSNYNVVLKGFDSDVATKIMHQNARKILNLPPMPSPPEDK